MRVESPSDTVDARVQRALLAVVLLGLGALGAALILALIQARRLADPLDRLARSATRLGDGDFSLATPRSGVPEIDAIASSLDRSAERVEEYLLAERRFSEHASHQLRTALTGLQLRIEELAGNDDPEVREEAEAALEQSARLLSIIEELLALARTGRAGNVSRFDLADLVRQHVDDIEPMLGREGRRAVVVAPEAVPVLATLGAVGQVLDILLSNSVRHGAGCVTATVSVDDRRARVDITDEGEGIVDRDGTSVFAERADRNGHGIGLASREDTRVDRGRHDLARVGHAAGVPRRAPAGLTGAATRRVRPRTPRPARRAARARRGTGPVRGARRDPGRRAASPRGRESPRGAP